MSVIFFICGKMAWQQGIGQFGSRKRHSVRSYMGWPCWNRIEPSASWCQGKGIFSHFRTCFVIYNLKVLTKGQRAAVNICQAYTGCLLSSRTSQRGKENIAVCFSSLCVAVQSESVWRFFVRLFFWGRWLSTSISFPRKTQDGSFVAMIVLRAASWGGDIVSHTCLTGADLSPAVPSINTVP